MLDANRNDFASFREIDFARSITLRIVELMKILIHISQIILYVIGTKLIMIVHIASE